MARRRRRSRGSLTVLPVPSPRHRQDHENDAGFLQALFSSSSGSGQDRQRIHLEWDPDCGLALVVPIELPHAERRTYVREKRLRFPADSEERVRAVLEVASAPGYDPRIRQAAEFLLRYLATGSAVKAAAGTRYASSYVERLADGVLRYGPEWLLRKRYFK